MLPPADQLTMRATVIAGEKAKDDFVVVWNGIRIGLGTGTRADAASTWAGGRRILPLVRESAGVLSFRFRMAGSPHMSESEVQRYRRHAEECRQEAAKVLSPRQKRDLLETAAQWAKLAQDAETRSAK
jgi:hypothetical protein